MDDQEPKEMMDHLEIKEFKAHEVLLENQDQLDGEESEDTQEQLDLQALLEILE